MTYPGGDAGITFPWLFHTGAVGFQLNSDIVECKGYGGSQGIPSHSHLYKLLFSYLFPESLSRNL